MASAPLHISTPGLMDALCNHEAMALWEVLRESGRALDPDELARRCGFTPARVATLLEQLQHAHLIECTRGQRGRRPPAFRVTIDEMRVAFDGIHPDLLADLFARWHASRVEFFEMMLMHRRRDPGRRPRGFCGSGSARLNSEERSRLKLLIEQVGSLMRNAALRPRDRAAASLDLDERIYAVLLRTEELASEPMRQPTGWSKYQETARFDGITTEQAFNAAKIGLGAADFALVSANRELGVVMGQHGMTMHDWNIVAGVYFRERMGGCDVKVIAEGSKDIGFSGDATSGGWTGRILNGMRSALGRSGAGSATEAGASPANKSVK